MPVTFPDVPDPGQHQKPRIAMSRFISRVFVSGDTRSRIYSTMAGLYMLVIVSWYLPLAMTKVEYSLDGFLIILSPSII